MRKTLVLLLIILSFINCKSSKRAKAFKTKTFTEALKNSEENTNTSTTFKIVSLQDSIANYAKKFEGVRYKWGGTTTSGMDCSGLVFESFRAHHIFLPRISRDMAKKGFRIALKNIQKGDLLFFKTSKSRRHNINHVGLVIEVKNKDITFIHSTTKRGVITSFLSETYWANTFFEARRYID
ncbi:C40 family peptidase [Aestuariivivens marinum]|uniref:C40 family peptidase n=1 Tax=Aestuariivivens marinum TaxID=2913555 RepID=UPI001F58C02D|nr:C40 family peptidase [Aestuariivivens marinum]